MIYYSHEFRYCIKEEPGTLVKKYLQLKYVLISNKIKHYQLLHQRNRLIVLYFHPFSGRFPIS